MKHDSYWERGKLFMGLADWFMVVLCVVAGIAMLWEFFPGSILLWVAAFCIWWGNVSHYYPKGSGPDD